MGEPFQGRHTCCGALTFLSLAGMGGIALLSAVLLLMLDRHRQPMSALGSRPSYRKA